MFPLLLYKASVSSLGAGHTSLPSKSKRKAKAAILLHIYLDFDDVRHQVVGWSEVVHPVHCPLLDHLQLVVVTLLELQTPLQQK